MDTDLVEEIKDAISFVAKDRFFYCMSEADLERCIAAELRDRDHVVLEQYPVVPTWHTAQGNPVALHGRRADLWILSKTGLRMLVELKIATKIEESHRAQALAYANATGLQCLIAVVDKSSRPSAEYMMCHPDPSVYAPPMAGCEQCVSAQNAA
jgi:hypothetical protein